MLLFFFFQAEDGIRDYKVTGVQTCALPISRLGVARANLEDDELDPALSRVVQDAPEQRAGEAPATALRANRDVGDVDFVGDLPEAEVADHPPLLTHDPAVRDAVLLNLVEEGPPRPGHGERRALDAEDLLEVLGAHAVN